MNGGEFVNGQPPKKKRGRPKKIRTEEVRPVPPILDMNGGLSNSFGGGSSSSNQSHMDARGPPSASPAPAYMGHPFVSNQPSVINHPPSQHPHAVVDYYGRAPSIALEGHFRDCATTCPLTHPLRRLRNQRRPHRVNSNSTLGKSHSWTHFQVHLITFCLCVNRMRDAISAQGPISAGPVEQRITPGENGESRQHQIHSPGVSKPQEQHQQPPRSHPGTPQPMAYRHTPPAASGVPYHVPNQVKVISCPRSPSRVVVS